MRKQSGWCNTLSADLEKLGLLPTDEGSDVEGHIRDVCDALKHLVQLFPEHLPQLFVGYEQGPHRFGESGHYVKYAEVEDFCERVEPEILRALRS